MGSAALSPAYPASGVETSLPGSSSPGYQLEQATIGQSENDLWNSERRIRVTASKYGEICKRQKWKGNSVEAYYYAKPFFSKAMQWGSDKEPVAIAEFERKYNKRVKAYKNYLTSSLENFCDFSSLCGENSVKISRNDIDLVHFKKIKCERRFLNTANEIRGLVVSPSICGLFVDLKLGYLAASPDGLVEGEVAIVEIKCPYSLSNQKIDDGLSKPNFHLERRDCRLRLKKDHNYMYQIQGNLAVSGRKTSLFGQQRRC
ncbi:uncharacterized protein [Bemisia tabaci]|uniref:uncharacterized protein n=1 Tax=Bemisia tabaci TaxID=7038 RepID=UPI003B28A8DA